MDGWVSLEVSPLLAYDTAGTLAAATSSSRAPSAQPHDQDPRDREGVPAIEEAIFAGIPINVTLLFSREQYFAAAEAYLRGIERRIEAGLSPTSPRWRRCSSVAGTRRWPPRCPKSCATSWASPWPAHLRAYRSLLGSPRWQRIYNAGARPQRLLWASTGTKDPASDVLYIKALRRLSPSTRCRKTLKALADHGELTGLLPADGGDCEHVLARVASAGVDLQALAERLQTEGAASFVKSWNALMAVIASKSAALGAAN